MAIRLLALDIDGTLTNQKYEVSPRNMRAIRFAQERGVFVTLATGRSARATKPIWQALNIHGPCIQFGGAWIIDTDTEEILEKHIMEPEIVREALCYAHEIGVWAQLYQGDTVIYEKSNAATERYIERHGLPFRIEPDMRARLYENVPKVLAFSELDRQDELLEAFRNRFRGICEVSRSMPGYIEINRLHATKGAALQRLAGMRGVLREEVAAIGDNYLDQDMIEWAGTGVCVANGNEAVKAIADLIVPACDDDGVASFIEQYI